MEFPAIDPVAFQIGPYYDIGPFEVRWYALAYLVGFLLGWGYALRLADGLRKERPYKTDIDDFMVWAIPGVIIGGRLGYVLFYNFSYFAANPLEILQVWHGGMSFHGGIIGVSVAMVLYAWKHKFNVFRLSDVVACAAPIGLFLGRIANFVNAELYGRVTDGPWGVIFPGTDGQPRHPSQLYEAALEGVLLFIMLFVMVRLRLHKTIPGAITGLFLFMYGFFRFLVEYVREPDEQLGLFFEVISMGQILCLPMMALGLAIIIYSIIKKPDDIRI